MRGLFITIIFYKYIRYKYSPLLLSISALHHLIDDYDL